MKYNQKRHIELLIKNQRKNLFRENPEENFELSQYNIAVEKHFVWQDRFQLTLLMENFLNKKIDATLFCDGILGLRRKLINRCDKFNLELISGSEKIKDFQPNERLKSITGFLTSLFCECDYFDVCECDYFDETEDYQEFYDSIENEFLIFQKILNEE